MGRRPLGQFQPGIMGLQFDLPFGAPGPGAPGIPGKATPVTTPYGLFPTNVKWGDVVNVTGNFSALHQGQAVVRFVGVPGIAPAILGPFGGSVVVPVGAQSGACQIEINGRVVFGTHCTISRGLSGGPPPARAPEHRAVRAWKNFGTGSPLGLVREEGPDLSEPGGVRTLSAEAAVAAAPTRTVSGAASGGRPVVATWADSGPGPSRMPAPTWTSPTPAAPAAGSMRTLLLVGAGAAALYLLFGRKR